MTGSLARPDDGAYIADLRRRVGILERRVAPTSAAGGINGDIIFSYAGELVSDTESPPVKVRYDGFLATLAVALGTAGSSSTTLTVKKNGTVITTVVIASGVADYVVPVGVRVYGEDRISLSTVTAGTGAAEMTATARFT